MVDRAQLLEPLNEEFYRTKIRPELRHHQFGSRQSARGLKAVRVGDPRRAGAASTAWQALSQLAERRKG